MDEGGRDAALPPEDEHAQAGSEREFSINSERERRLLREILAERERREERATERRADCRTLRISITSALVVLVCTFALTGSSAPWWLAWVVRLLHLDSR